MSVRVMTWVWEHSASKGMDRLVLLAIADCAADDGANAFPSMAKLVAKTGLTDRGIQKCIARLEASGELRVKRNGGPRGCNRYRLPMRATPEQGSPPNVVRGEQDSGELGSPPEHGAPQPPNDVRGTPEQGSPGTVLEPSVEPSVRTKTTGRTRGTRIPDDFQATPEMIAWARQHTPLAGRTDTDAFVDYWRGKSGKDGIKLDWPATWRNWMRRAQSDRESRSGRTAKPHQPYRNPADMSVYEEGL